MERKLTTILAADVVGYSRLMGEDEVGTLARLKSLRKELMQPKIAGSRGRIVKLMGDGLLAEFPSVVEAVRCAVDIQQNMAGREAGLPEERRIRLRIGVNLGDIIVEGSDIYGDGVNVAARPEGLAEPGGVCISGKVYEEVRNKLPAAFKDLGDQKVKNIREPVRVYRWTGAAADPMPGTAGAEGALPLPDKPSIAVLPFTNMSGDPEQEYFSDGITEDVITELSRFRDLFVIGRNSTFTYKGQAVNLQKVGRELGVGYLVEGSVRKAGNRVRVTAQLIHAESGNHLWAERYDRDLTDIFAVQDEITRNVVSAIAPGVLAAEDASGRRKAPENLNAWACVVRGNARMWNIRREDFEAASALFDQAISLDPNYARARSAKAFLTVWRAFQGWSVRTSEDVAQALASARRALALDANDSMAHYALGFVHTLGRHPDLALDAMRSAIELNPNSAEAHFGLGMALVFAGETEAALEALDTARQLNPRGLFDANITAFQAMAHLLSGRDEEAARLAAQSIEDRPDFVVSLMVQAAGLAHLDRMEEARDAAAKVMQMIPKFSLAKHERWTPIVRAKQRARYLEGLRKAGLPE